MLGTKASILTLNSPTCCSKTIQARLFIRILVVRVLSISQRVEDTPREGAVVPLNPKP